MPRQICDSSRTAVSLHARVRQQQRCIPAGIRDLLLDFGESTSAGRGAQRFFFDKKSWRRVESYLGPHARHFEKYRSVYVILSKDGVVITEGWLH